MVFFVFRRPKFVRQAHPGLKPIYHWHDDRDREMYDAAIEKRIRDEWTSDQLDHRRALLVSVLFGIGAAWMVAWFSRPKSIAKRRDRDIVHDDRDDHGYDSVPPEYLYRFNDNHQHDPYHQQ